MTGHPAFKSGNVAVITGGADGIGLAAAHYFKSMGMEVCLADINAEKLALANTELGDVATVICDVSQLTEVESLKAQIYEQFGRVDVLMNNAGVARPCDSWSQHDAWQAILGVNLWGVINGIHAFATAMIEQKSPGLIINTGSKQGITTPPGNPAYNVSKAGVKSVTEALQHNLRNTEGCQISAHLLVPGFTYTGMIKAFLPEKPDGAWGSEQVIAFMVEAIARGDFYILCPDNDTSREQDNKRMAWAMGDLIENRPALSRWHPDFQSEFNKFMET
jgi:NAD(P)-dependent dehydrogenase (short-subunit alcohol dehydrogenase family)